MRRKQLRLGSITLLFTVIVLCVATLSALSAATAHADKAVADKYAAQVAAMYEAEEAGQEWLAAVHAAIAAKGAALEQADLPQGTTLSDGTISVELALDNGRTLSIALQQADTAPGYRILRWENTAQWTENTDIGNLWTGGSASQGA